MIRINLESTFRLMRAAARPMMKAKFGRIINITSIVGSTGNPGQMNYCAAKGGVTAMSKSLAQELASRGLTVNCVAPGAVPARPGAGTDPAGWPKTAALSTGRPPSKPRRCCRQASAAR